VQTHLVLAHFTSIIKLNVRHFQKQVSNLGYFKKNTTFAKNLRDDFGTLHENKVDVPID
jgi:hypothetical protein